MHRPHAVQGQHLQRHRKSFSLTDSANPNRVCPHFHPMNVANLFQDMDSTFQLYSSFTTQYMPPQDYETLMVSASKTKAHSVKAWERREQHELTLVCYSKLQRTKFLQKNRNRQLILWTPTTITLSMKGAPSIPISSVYKGYMRGQLLKQRRKDFLESQGLRRLSRYFGRDTVTLWCVASSSATDHN